MVNEYVCMATVNLKEKWQCQCWHLWPHSLLIGLSEQMGERASVLNHSIAPMSLRNSRSSWKTRKELLFHYLWEDVRPNFFAEWKIKFKKEYKENGYAHPFPQIGTRPGYGSCRTLLMSQCCSRGRIKTSLCHLDKQQSPALCILSEYWCRALEKKVKGLCGGPIKWF